MPVLDAVVPVDELAVVANVFDRLLVFWLTAAAVVVGCWERVFVNELCC